MIRMILFILLSVPSTLGISPPYEAASRAVEPVHPRRSRAFVHHDHDTSNTSKLHFLAFGNYKYGAAIDRIEEEVKATRLFPQENIHIFRTLPDTILNDQRWKWHLGNEGKRRGSGYWFWKAALASHLFQTAVPKGGILVYVDSGCDLASTQSSMKMWTSMLDKMASRDIIAFQTTWAEKILTKGDIFSRFDTTPGDPYYGESRQIAATYFIIKNSAPSNEFLEKWLTLVSDPQLISDRGSVAKNAPNFKVNRHDQSLFSMLIKGNEPESRCAVLPNVSHSRSPKWGVAGLKISVINDLGYPVSPCSPFAATRNKARTPRWNGAIDESECDKSLTSAALKCMADEEDSEKIHDGQNSSLSHEGALTQERAAIRQLRVHEALQPSSTASAKKRSSSAAESMPDGGDGSED